MLSQLFSWLHRTSRKDQSREDYERLLGELDRQVHHVQVQMAEGRLRERAWVVRLLGAGTFTYVAIIAYVFLLVSTPSMQHLMLLIIFPFGLYYAKRSVNWLAGRQLAHLEQHLRALKAKQRLKIEELKERSDYYRTQKLLERFDVASPAATHNNKKTGPKNQSSKLESTREDTKQIDEGTASSASLSSSISSSMPLSSTLSLSSGMAARLVHPRGWLDRWTDYVLGEEEAMVRYALVCTRCYAHNGLSLVPLTPFACRRCSHVNNLPPSSATSTGHAPPQGSDEDATAVSKKGAPQRHALEERIRRQLSTVASPDQDATPLAQAPQHLWPPKRDSNHDSAEEEQKSKVAQ